MRLSRILVPALAAVALGTGVALADGPKKNDIKAGIEPPAKAIVVTSATRLGKAETAQWTATTLEAATAEANKKVLESGKVTTVTGEVVDVSCYLQLGKRGEAHVACGTKCIANGQPIGIVDEKGELTILFAEEHHPRRDGQLDLKGVFLPLLAKQVTVTGMGTEMRGTHALFIQGAEIGASVKTVEVPPAATPSK